MSMLSTVQVADAKSEARAFWLANGLPEDLLHDLSLTQAPDPAVNSSFKLGTVAQTTIGLSGLSAAFLHHLRGGERQTVSVNARHALLEFKSEVWYLIDGELPKGALFDDLAGIYKTKDNSCVLIHTNFPHHKQGILDILKCEATRASIQSALLQWNAEDFENEASARKVCAVAFRTFRQWDMHPQAEALRGVPPVELIKVGDAPKRSVLGLMPRPLGRIRVLDLTRVLAGPICGRTLAAHGADVLWVTSPKLPDLPYLDKDTSRGKRTAQLDLTDQSDRDKLAELAGQADVFLQSYRPGGLKDKGFGVKELAKLRPGIVYASLTAYGWNGPWKSRRGFDSLVQMATGFGHAEAEAYHAFDADSPSFTSTNPNTRRLPCQAIDHAAGYLLAFGINAALCKTIMEGGSWEVRVSLAAVGQWIRSLGQLDSQTAFGEGPILPLRGVPQAEELAAHSVGLKEVKHEGEAGVAPRSITAIGHAAKLCKTPVREGEAPMILNAHKPEWLSWV